MTPDPQAGPPRPIPALRFHVVTIPPAPAWPRGLVVEVVVGRRRRVRRFLDRTADPGEGVRVQVGLGRVRAAVRLRPGE